ncbi:MAG: DNA topoisomerase I [Candidatus Diapherotrites archaeon]|nr:DNA topoisomerase I [Candidatus Diapherotrites archaeon]
MILIISEKAIAGKRIAEILAGGRVATKIEGMAQLFEFDYSGRKAVVVPLRGHIVDVDFPKKFSSWLGTDLKQLAKAPIDYVETEKRICDLLRRAGQQVDTVIVATDSDREGESIGVEALRFVKEKNGKAEIKRANFSAIIDKDIKEAFSRLGNVDYNFADSADARREIDLVFGAVLTRFLSLMAGRMGKEFLSMGRVQGPTLWLIVEREKARMKFESTPYWELLALFEKDKKGFEASHKKGRFLKREEAEKVLAKRQEKCVVSKVSKTKKTLSRPIPFNTTGFLRAATGIGISASRAMSLAESLYTNGFISYPRTDNTVYPKNLDLRQILQALREVSEFHSMAEQLLAKKEPVPSRGPKETTDHPPIHPVSACQREKISADEWKVYELVCRHFFATLAEDAQTENLSVEILMKDEPFVARGQVFIKKGWKEFYPYSKASEVILPPLAEGDEVLLKKLDLLSKQTEPPGRYSEGSLISLMESHNLGTKSTRPAIIQKLFQRKYVSGKSSIVPNKIAFAVIDSIEKYDKEIVRPKFTADLETEMDFIAAGKKTKAEVVDQSTDSLLANLGILLQHRDSIAAGLRSALRDDSIVSACNKDGCGGNLILRHGKTGKRFVGCSNYPKCTNSYPLPQKGSITPLNEFCKECNAPMVKVLSQRFSYTMCLNMGCVSKKDWKKKDDNSDKSKAAPGNAADKS